MRSAFRSKNPIKNLKYCIQRILRGYCDADLWAIYEWFLLIIVPILRQFSESQMGWPMWLQEQCIAELGDRMNNEEIDEICQQRWKMMLNELADDFERIEEFNDDLETVQQREALKNDCFKRFSEYFFNLWD